MKTAMTLLTSITLSALLAACGGGGDSSDVTYTGTGELSLSITDAPVDGAKAVWITIDGIYLKRASGSGDEKFIELSGPQVDPVDGTLTVNLLDLSGGQVAQLFNSEEVTSGDYQWVRFSLVNGTAKIVWNDDSEDPLTLPANKNELKTSGSFSVGVNSSVAYIIDWDLRKSIVEYSGGYRLKPVLHIKRDDVFGYINGVIADSLYDTCDTDGIDEDEVPVVYIFSGADVTPDDMDATDGTVEPVASVYVSADPNQAFYAGPLDPGSYTFAFTCDSASDDPEQDDVLEFPLEGRRNVDLVSGANGAITIP